MTFALWMFGIININIANTLANKTDKAGQASSSVYFGSFLLGVAFSITSFSCTVPVVGTHLVIAADGTTRIVLTSLYGMIIYGLVFAAPFVALSLYPKALDRLPNSGSWMDTVKVVFGFIILSVSSISLTQGTKHARHDVINLASQMIQTNNLFSRCQKLASVRLLRYMKVIH